MGVIKEIHQKIIGVLIVLAFALLPIYIFPSGGAQIIDIVILFLGMIVIFRLAQHEIYMIAKVTFILLVLAIYTLIVNTVFIFFYSDFGYFLASIQTLYPVFIFFVFAIAFKRLLKTDSGIKYMYIAMLVASVLPWTITGAYESPTRNALSFNNPNQLGYYSVLLYICWSVINYHHKFLSSVSQGRWWKTTINFYVVVSVHLFTLLSFSRASITALMIINFYHIAKLLRKRFFFTIIIFICVSIAGVMCYKYFLKDFSIEDKIIARFQQIEYERELDKRLLKRLEAGQQEDIMIKFIFGTGGAKIEQKEVHNIFGAMFRSYGLVGTIILVMIGIFYTSFVYQLPGAIWYLSAIFIYNMSHNGIRFRPFWIIIALILSISYITKERYKSQAIRSIE